MSSFRTFLTMTTGIALTALVAVPVQAQTTDDKAKAAAKPEEAAPALEEIIVKGIRGSVESARNKKRNSKQIVDSIVSEDAGKLPDNNVPEAMSRVAGVQITRERGQGQSVAIRGLDGVQTTVNGTSTNLGDGRSMSLADVPAELIKSVEIFKTRTADQIEGSIAGAVNIELRRPLDMKNGTTVAGSLKTSYDTNAKSKSPSGSLLVSDRFDTDYGEIGLLVNGSYGRTKYNETYIDSESPDFVCCVGDNNSAWGRLPSNQKNIIIPYRAQYGVEDGYVDRSAISTVLQWRPNDEWEFILEGSYVGNKEKQQVDRLFALMREPSPTLTDIKLLPDGKTVSGVTVTQANGVPVGIDSLYLNNENNLYSGNIEANWKGENLTVSTKAKYSKSNQGNYNVEHLMKPTGLTSATIDFLSPVTDAKAPTISLNGVDLSNISAYGIERFQDLKFRSTNDEFAGQVDLTWNVSENKLLRSIQTGGRYVRRDTARNYGYRDGFPRVNGAFAPLSSFPGGTSAELTGPDLDGAQQWYRVPGKVVTNNIANILAYIRQTDPGNAQRFSSEFPPADLGQEQDSTENVGSGYAMVNYAFDMGVPVDGNFGVRYTRTWGDFSSTSYRIVKGALVTEPSQGTGDYDDYLPSANAIIHFTPKTQLRLAYSTDVQRPSFYDLRPFYFVDPSVTNPTVDAGNPKLKAQTVNQYDISAEYYFGHGGVASLGGFYKKATNFLYASRESVSDLADYGLPGRSGFVSQQRNAGDGTFVGLEGQFTTFFDFLPGFLANFGSSINATRMIKARVEYPYPEDFPGAFDSVNTSKWTGNLALFYDTPEFSARVAMNYRSSYRMFVWPPQPAYSWYMNDTFRLDAAVNYTPVEYATLSLEATNLTNSKDYSYFGQQNLLPRGVRIQARTVQASIRFRY